MKKHNRGAPPKGSDAERAGQLEGGGALPPNQIGEAAENAEHVEEKNDETAKPTPPLDEPGKVEDLTGGAGALPGSLAPAAANARNAERVSDMQAEMAKRPENPNEVKREKLREIAAYVGSATTARVLSRFFGTDDPNGVNVGQLDHAIDELHKAADEPKEG